MENIVLKKFREGRPSLGTFTDLNSPLAVQSLGYTALDYVLVDTEHAPVGIESAAEGHELNEVHVALPCGEFGRQNSGFGRNNFDCTQRFSI